MFLRIERTWNGVLPHVVNKVPMSITLEGPVLCCQMMNQEKEEGIPSSLPWPVTHLTSTHILLVKMHHINILHVRGEIQSIGIPRKEWGYGFWWTFTSLYGPFYIQTTEKANRPRVSHTIWVVKCKMKIKDSLLTAGK